MNFKKVLSLVLVIALSVTLFAGCGNEENTNMSTTDATTPTPSEQDVNADKSIVVVSQNDNPSSWKNVKKGAEDAAKKYGYSLEFIGGDEDEKETDSQTEQLQRIVNDGVSGVVIASMDEGYANILSKLYDEKVPVVHLADDISDDNAEALSESEASPIVSTVTTAYKDAGALCAEKVFEAVKDDMSKNEGQYVVGIIQEDNVADSQEKDGGFVEKFTELADADDTTKGKYKIEEESEESIEEAFNNLIQADVKAMFLTSQRIADKVSDIVSADAEKYREIVFCGFDSGAKQLKWLNEESGPVFIGAVARDSYNLGYNAVEQCIFSVEDKDVKEKIEIEGQWYDRSNVDKMKQDGFVFDK